ncbi:UDP-N-acetylmuramate--L-alanine ligase [Leptospira sp. GIMC2001]|uniref:UDP-N-acetylmuramate--L-alanine ligase n=1 Tax=Leptospira sp. GIMC2001 TaxID=1513297 RepID=UPI00234A90BB|nr:UDP-N-acetylmuramate--L-alanine ligase [Leptospira sp. GIMC2001]WCL47986.1 UDP-N-acetylmuramate--L-alanine ligase [Leptospira sp. GIMC2001]
MILYNTSSMNSYKSCFVLGIGGSGMSSLAHILIDRGIQTIGYDKGSNKQTSQLVDRGILFFQTADAFIESGVVPEMAVHSSAIKDHPLLDWLRDKGIPIFHRSEVMHSFFAEKMTISIAGSHGKTTTTAMVSQIFLDLNLDPSIMIGGETDILNGRGGRWGQGPYGVYESDESDGTFLNHLADYRILTNIDDDHLDHYINRDNLTDSFASYLNTKDGKKSIAYIGDSGICEALKKDIDVTNIILVGERSDFEILKSTIPHSLDQFHRFNYIEKGFDSWKLISDEISISYSVPFYGDHYRINASLAIALGLELGLDPQSIQNSISKYKGVKRRMEVLGSCNGASIIDDYGHHPTEVKAVLTGFMEAKEKGNIDRVIVIFQPHRFTRTQNLFKDFANELKIADKIFILPIYSAGEEPISGVSSNLIFDELIQSKPDTCLLQGDIDKDCKQILPFLQNNNVLITLGAGSVRSWGERLIENYST